MVLPDIIRPQSQTAQLVALEENQYVVPTIGEILTMRQLILYRGTAVALALASLVVGILVRVFSSHK